MDNTLWAVLKLRWFSANFVTCAEFISVSVDIDHWNKTIHIF